MLARGAILVISTSRTLSEHALAAVTPTPTPTTPGGSVQVRFDSGGLLHSRSMTTSAGSSRTRQMLNKVPEVTVYFWVIKILCTTVGESLADYINEQ